MAFIKDEILIRRCRYCEITSDLIEFRKQKNSRNGKVYTHNVCIACFEDIHKTQRRRYYLKYREEQIKISTLWNIENRERYNKRRRKPWILKGISKYRYK